jgi:DNA-binding transcriptional ArsR family regulator
MPATADIAAVAALLADPTRAVMLFALSDGRSLPAGELARQARVSPSTASHHLSALVVRQWLAIKQQGRHRYFRLADPGIAHVLETLAIVAPPAPVRSLSQSEAARALRAARMCYRNLAGALGVALARAMVGHALLEPAEDGYLLTSAGMVWLRHLGVADASWRHLQVELRAAVLCRVVIILTHDRLPVRTSARRLSWARTLNARDGALPAQPVPR